MEYGTGAVMAVPAHDQRDFEFAKTYQLPIKQVIVPKGEKAKDPLTESYTESGDLIESGSFTGMDNETAKKAIITELENKRCGVATIQYRLRDWGVSRQRFWGLPFPLFIVIVAERFLFPKKIFLFNFQWMLCFPVNREIL